MKYISFTVIMSMMVLFFFSCRSTKKLQTAVSKKDTVIPVKILPATTDSLKAGNELFAKLNTNRIDFKTFAAKIRVEYEDSKKKQPEVTANLRMKKDSIIWISIVGNFAFITVEAFRVMITKDQITVINKLDKEVAVHSFSYIEDIAKIPLDFKTLQDLIVGNPLYLGDKVVSYKQTENRILLSTVGKYFKNLLTLSASNNSIERSKLDDLDVTLNRTADLTYGEYDNKSGMNFATYREITVAEKTKVDIKLNFKQYEFNTEQTYPFTIPKNYKTK